MHWKIMTFHRCHRCYRSIYLYAEEKIIHVVKWKFDLKLPFKRFEDRMFDILLKSSSKLQNLINWQSLEDTQVGYTSHQLVLTLFSIQEIKRGHIKSKLSEEDVWDHVLQLVPKIYIESEHKYSLKYFVWNDETASKWGSGRNLAQISNWHILMGIATFVINYNALWFRYGSLGGDGWLFWATALHLESHQAQSLAFST